MKPSSRIADIKQYFFVGLGENIIELKNQGVDVIRLDMGSPDLPPADFIIDTLVENARNPDNHGYTPYGGTKQFRQAVSKYYHQRFIVDLDSETEVVGLIGSKEGIFKLTQAIIDPGDVVLVPSPGYTTYSASAKIAGGEIYWIPLLESKDYLPVLEDIPTDILNRAKLLWLNYPNNPTGAIAPLSFFEEVITFASKYNILVAHDAAYVDVCFDGYKAPSILEVPGAKKVAVEFGTFSKSYNMAGWRLGMACGYPDVLRYLSIYKVQSDTAHFGPVLQSGIAALTGDQTWISERNLVYQARRDKVIEALQSTGLKVVIPKAALYVWARLPDGVSDVDFCKKLLWDTGVSVIPGSIYGENGTGYIRISICHPLERIADAMTRIISWLAEDENRIT